MVSRRGSLSGTRESETAVSASVCVREAVDDGGKREQRTAAVDGNGFESVCMGERI